MITAKINVTRIDNQYLFEGKSGKYLDIALFTNRDGPDQYGNDGFITQGIPKEKRDAGEKGPIIGNWKEMTTGASNGGAPDAKPAARPAAAPAPAPTDDTDLPF